MKVILAEKPSVARDIAAVVGAKNKREGFFEGNGYAVTYAFGHLVTIAEPEEMNAAWGKPWRMAQLPMVPDQWKHRIADKASAQFNVIKRLFRSADTDSIICATDAGREGEHIFRLIYQSTGSDKPVERLWISSLTAEAIRDGLNKLKPASDFDNLADAASGRAHADWIVGLNFTRAYTILNKQLCTIGRVQTPTLALIVERQALIEKFQSSAFYEILATFEPGFVARYISPGAEPQTRLTDKAQAQSIVDSVKSEKHGYVSTVSTIEKKTKAPALYDLLTLQKEANKRFGYTAKETLDIAQSLYEEYKLLSYPRTESRHLSNDMIDELPGVLTAVLKSSMATDKVRDAFAAEKLSAGSITADMLRPRLGKTYVDDAKLTDHHAIIPTHKAPSADLPEKQRNIYKLVATRFLSIFLPPEVKDETTAIIKLGDHSFRAKGTVIKELGWTILDEKSKEPEKKSKAKDADAADESQQLPPLANDQQLDKRKVDLKEGKTTPPKPYDDSSLLTAMKNAGQELDDEDLASYMKQRGLGTPATRAAIIERLLQTGYIVRNKKALFPTEKGTALIGQVHTDLKDVRLTAGWEQRLADMQDGKLKLPLFESDIAQFVQTVLPKVIESSKSLPAMPVSPNNAYPNKAASAKQSGAVQDGEGGAGGGAKPADGIAACPQCKVGMVRPTPKGAGCSRWREGCTFSIWREQYGKELSDAQIKELLKKGQTKVIKGFKKKSGNGTYDAKLVLNEEFKVRLQFEDGAAGGDSNFGPCPQCKEGTVRRTPKGAGCTRWKEGCTFSIWREQYGLELPDEVVKELVEKRSTGLIKGFKKKNGSGTYDARLVLNNEFKTRLSFDFVDAAKEMATAPAGS